MAKIKKKGESGQAKNFITRTQAVRKLQISLPDFRRLCIFKGIYPREPRNKKKASKSSTQSTTFYYTKDIQYLLHEPILLKFREHKAFEKKLAKALGRGEVKDAARIEKASKPKISLDHIIKERYPTFVDAIRDLDDALSMLFLFANLPSTSTVPPKTIALCERLCLEFQHYLIITHSLRKSFLSIKGIYYQATIQGQDIMWLVPYKFAQRITEDVDFRIMGTFVEFYTTLLGFVNFRLYTSIGLVYPPKFDKSSDDKGGELGAFTLEGSEMREPRLAIEGNGNEEDDGAIIQNDTKSINQKIASLPPLSELQPDSIADDEENKEEEENTGKDEEDQSTRVIDKFEVAAGGDVDVLAQPAFTESEGPGQLFAPFTFFLGRETPRQPLEFILRSFGCKRVGWDVVLGDGAFVTDENDTRITHQVVDRPQIIPQTFEMDDSEEEENEDEEEKRQSLVKQSTLGKRVPGRTYVQPQWVWDCINAGKLLRPDQYAPGAELPPHLSPWVKPGKGQYDPAAPLAAQERVGEAEGLASGSEEISDEESEASSSDMGENKGTVTITEVDEEDIGGMTVDISANSEDEFEEDEEWDGLEEEIAEESEDEATKEHALHQRELEAEAAGLPFLKSSMSDVSSKTKVRDEARKKAARKRKEEEEELERQKMMMSRKKRKILDKMLYSNKRKDDEAEALRAKRRKLEKIASGT